MRERAEAELKKNIYPNMTEKENDKIAIKQKPKNK
jgi:hypothetical protein